MISLGLGALSAALTLGCAHSGTRRADLSRLVDELAQRSASDADVGVQASRLGRTVDVSDGVDLAEAETIALALAPPLRAARTAARGAGQVAAATGAWPTPTLSLEALVVVSGGGSPPVRVGAGVEFPIPLSDRLDAAMAEANAAHTVALLAVAVEERHTVLGLRHAWIRWTAAERRAQALDAHVARISPFLTAAEQLATAGELEPDAVQLWRLAARRVALQSLAARSQASRARLAVVAQLGLPSASPLQLTPSLVVEPGPRLAVPEHPEVRLALAKAERARAALREAEAAGAGELRVGPKVLYEEGATAVGGTLTVPLGAQEGSGRAVAAAAGELAVAEESLGAALFTLSAHAQQAEADAAAAGERLARLEADYAPLVAAQLAHMQQLVATGEFSLVSLRETLELELELELQRLEARTEAAEAHAELSDIAVPARGELQ